MVSGKSDAYVHEIDGLRAEDSVIPPVSLAGNLNEKRGEKGIRVKAYLKA